MKNSNFKKHIIVLVISFFAFVGITNASFEDPLTDLQFQGNSRVVNKNEYINLVCKPEGTLKALTLTEKDDAYYIRYDKEPSETGTDKIKCTWDGENVVGFTEDKGYAVFTYSYSKRTVDSETGILKELQIPFNGSMELLEQSRDIIQYLGLNLQTSKKITITAVNKSRDGMEYLDWSECPLPATKCGVKVTSSALAKHETLTTSADITYTIEGEKESRTTKAIFLISVSGGIRAWTGGYGTCSFNSQWKPTEFEGSKYYETVVTGNATLPSCSVSDSSTAKVKSALEFKGWVSVPNNQQKNLDYQRIGVCASKGAIPANTAVPANDGKSYVACFEFKQGIQIAAPMSGLVVNDVGSCTNIATGVYFCDGTGSRTLPTVTFTGVMADTMSLQGWRRESDGAILKAGDTVEYDGDSYTAVTQREVKERDYYKIIYVGQNDFLSVDGMKSCAVASNPYLTAEYQGGECFVVGKQATDKNQYVDVNVGIENSGSTKNVTYKFEVKNRGNNSEAGDNGEFVIDVGARIESGVNNASSLNDFAHPMCELVNITHTGGSTNLNEKLRSDNYAAKSSEYCNNDPRTANKTYFALCIDPGRSGPTDKDEGTLYYLTQDVARDSDFGKLIAMIIYYINNKTSPAAFKNASNSVRVAAHVAIRAIAIADSYSSTTDQADSQYAANYTPYKKLADDLTASYKKYEDNNGFIPSDKIDALRSEVQTAVTTFGLNDSTAFTYLVDILTNYKNYTDDDSSSLERTIDSTEVSHDNSNGYTITYKGTISLPNDTRLVSSTGSFTYMNHGGATGKATLTRNNSLSTSSPYREVYDYVVVITVPNASTVKLPQNPQEELEYSLKLTYSGGIDFSSVRIANPASTAAAKQRLMVFDINGTGGGDGSGDAGNNGTLNDAYIYFDIEPRDAASCGLVDALDYKLCPSESNCDPKFNQDLFRSSGCCRYVLDEKKYSYIMNNLCNGDCAVSTMSNVCSYDPNYTGSTDLYEIKEGAYYSENERQYTNAIGTCIVNVQGYYGKEENRKDSYQRFDTPTGESGKADDAGYFQKYDDGGNSIMVASYVNNQYCQVSCREEWTFTMGAFGNFVGKNSVLAGRFFQNAENDIFIEGKRTCYTTYLDYDFFMSQLVELSKKIVPAYNNYSNASHAYTDIEEQKKLSATTNQSLKFEYDDNACVVWESVEHTAYRDSETELEADGKTPKKESYTDYYEWKCKTYNKDLTNKFGYFTLELNHEFEGEGDEGKGTYNNYTLTTADNVLNHTQGQSKPTKAYVDDPAHNQYSQDMYNTDVCSYGAAPTGHTTTKQADRDVRPTNCYEGNTALNRKSAFDELAQEMQTDDDSSMETEYGVLTSAYNEIKKKYRDFWECQHFELYNSTDDNNNHTNNTSLYGTLMGKQTPYVSIVTQFDPYVSYTYDEEAYMTILQDDNILIQHTTLNDSFFEKAGYSAGFNASTNVSVPATVGFTDRCELSGECSPTPDINVTLSRNKLSYSYYNPEGGSWRSNSDEARNYHDANSVVQDGIGKPSESDEKKKVVTVCSIGKVDTGKTHTRGGKEGFSEEVPTLKRVSVWEGGECYDYSVYYTEAHYMKASITNSSFYRNKGIWYTGPNDTREHGETLEEAWDNASKRAGGPRYTDRSDEAKRMWSVFVGSKNSANVIKGNLNLFPISLTTPRNLYQYTYEFTQIGSYTDGKLSRIMGDASSIISNNARTCFYEVTEDLCLCCGDPIVTYANTLVPSAQDFVNETDYDYVFSETEDIVNSNNGMLGFSPSTVALSDLNTSTDRKLGANWTGKAAFYYSGNKLYTNKGEVALKEIEDKGETVYQTTAEYSFTLKPSALAAIRDYNDRYGYEVNYDNLKVYGRSSIQPMGSCSGNPENCKWFTSSAAEEEEMNNYIANFGHYGSTFLEEMQSKLNLNYDPVVRDEGSLLNIPESRVVCAITRNDNTDNAKDTLSDLVTNSSRRCRWIDYIERQDNVKTVWDNVGSTQYYRLAFK